LVLTVTKLTPGLLQITHDDLVLPEALSPMGIQIEKNDGFGGRVTSTDRWLTRFPMVLKENKYDSQYKRCTVEQHSCECW
jgi:hypothetical protein